MANGIEELFPELANEETSPSTTGQPQGVDSTPPATEAASLPSPEVMELRGQVGQLTQVVGQLLQRPAYVPPQQQQEQPGQVNLNKLFEDTTFFTPDDTRQLLNTTTPEKEFNRMGNAIKKQVAEPLLGVIARQNQELQTYAQRQQQWVQQQEAARISQTNQEQFYGAHPELKRFERFVEMEAARMEQEYNTNPALRSLSAQQAHKLLADRARNTLTAYGVNMEQAPEPQAASNVVPLSQHTRKPGFMERGGSSRAPAQQASKDPNRRELNGMAQHLSRKTQRNAA